MGEFDRKQFSAYTAQYGTITGVFWVLSFSCYIMGLSNSFFGLFSSIFGITSIIVASMLVRKFKQSIAPLHYFRVWYMSFMIFVYASILMAAAQFIYFRFIDNGFVADTYSSIITSQEFDSVLRNMTGYENSMELAQQTIDLLYTISPIELTFNFFFYNIFISLLLSLPVSWIGASGKSKTLNK